MNIYLCVCIVFNSDVRENYVRAKWERKEFMMGYNPRMSVIEGTKEGYLCKKSANLKVYNKTPYRCLNHSSTCGNFISFLCFHIFFFFLNC